MKRIYIEISNVCNLECSFCKKDSIRKRFLSVNEFDTIINKIKGYTKHIYLHVKGEPFIHPNLRDLLDIAYNNEMLVNITTNGTMIDFELLNHPAIRQINVSLHAYPFVSNKKEYLNDLIRLINYPNKSFNLSLRQWVKNSEVLEALNDVIFDDKTFLNYDDEFVWPSMDNKIYNENRSCLGGSMQIGILSNGTIVPCCLDSEGIINLGNIFDLNLDDVFRSQRYINLIEGFKKKKCSEELCKRCGFNGRKRSNQIK